MQCYYPHPITLLVEFESPPPPDPAKFKSPKSCVSPVVEIVTYEMALVVTVPLGFDTTKTNL